MKSKLGAIELTMGTIVIVVLAVTMLIIGIVFVKSIMCSGIVISEELSVGVKNEVRSLFGADEIGVKCVGEGGQEITFATGGKRQVVCIIKTEEQAKYQLTLKDIENINGKTATEKAMPEKWVMGDASGQWDVSPGGKGTEAVVVVLNIPKDAPASYLKLTISAENKDTAAKTTHTSYINIAPSGFMKTTLC